MKERILEWAGYVAPSGSEGGLQEALLGAVREAADEVRVDVLGNGIATKRGEGPHVVLVAHADEPGVMAIHVDERGFLRLISIGDVPAHELVGRQVRFTNGVTGIIGVEGKVKREDIGFEHLYADIGAESEEEARSRVPLGTAGVVWEPLSEIGTHRLAGRALDNRAGCAVAAEAFLQLAALGRRVSVVFSAQQAVGARGAGTAAFQLNPDLAIVIDAAPAGDMPEAPRMALSLGKGPCVKIMDGTAVVPLDVKDHLVESARRLGLAIQYEVWPRGLSDAGAVQLSQGGVKVGGVSYPARRLGGLAQVIDLRDVAGAVRLVVEAARSW
ncbi:peptidase M42 [Alicyclobacillus macrosporangiidus]|jgi:putative aminopeptidase FrvX|uniref:Endoglucanase n=1 Tax=Alicyclobacillus macrosporangiidus TaxID=392015 RepID=A0A1I7KTU4_9BACL|nr:peptidase M42 [Alicyclobacillus macrosporangiidus]SFV00724.1 endoglucanase [Alicyclobacillus macrosporangiidus]